MFLCLFTNWCDRDVPTLAPRVLDLREVVNTRGDSLATVLVESSVEGLAEDGYVERLAAPYKQVEMERRRRRSEWGEKWTRTGNRGRWWNRGQTGAMPSTRRERWSGACRGESARHAAAWLCLARRFPLIASESVRRHACSVGAQANTYMLGKPQIHKLFSLKKMPFNQFCFVSLDELTWM